jgi:hypothetical protein
VRFALRWSERGKSGVEAFSSGEEGFRIMIFLVFFSFWWAFSECGVVLAVHRVYFGGLFGLTPYGLLLRNVEWDSCRYRSALITSVSSMEPGPWPFSSKKKHETHIFLWLLSIYRLIAEPELNCEIKAGNGVYCV